MWKIDLKNRIAESECGLALRSDGGDNWVILKGSGDENLIAEGKSWFLHEYSKHYIEHLKSKRGLSISDIADITNKEINAHEEYKRVYGSVSKEQLIELLTDKPPLFSIDLCSLIRRAAYFQLK